MSNTEGYVIAERSFGYMGNLLITGGAGFLGSSLAKRAREKDWNVRILDNLSTGLETTTEMLKAMGIEVILGGIRHSMANIERIQSTLGWKPEVDFQEGIEGLVRERLRLKEDDF